MANRRKKRKASTVSAYGGPMDGVLAKGLSHPLRAEILAFLNDQQSVASPVEMERAGLGRNGQEGDLEKRKLSNLAYHVRVLADLGLVREVGSRQVRGSTEHFYEANARMLLDLDEWAQLPDRAKNDVSVKALEETLGRAAKAISAGTFDSFDERAVINLPLRLDDEGFVQLADEMTEFMARCEQVQSEAVQRVNGNMSQLMHASASLLLYESPPPKPADSGDAT